jgi:hypothetical protein
LIEILCTAIETPRVGIEDPCRGFAASRSFISGADCELDPLCAGAGIARAVIDRLGAAIAKPYTGIGALDAWLENGSPAIPVVFRTRHAR